MQWICFKGGIRKVWCENEVDFLSSSKLCFNYEDECNRFICEKTIAMVINVKNMHVLTQMMEFIAASKEWSVSIENKHYLHLIKKNFF